MEQAYKRLLEKLTNHPLVDQVSYNYYYFTVIWKSGIKERLIKNKFDNKSKYRFRKYMKSYIRPHFMPRAMWWEHLSNGHQPKPHYLENVEFEDDVDKYSNLINFKWSDYEKCGFYERLILIHTILQYVSDHGWKEQQYPENTLRKSLQLAYDESQESFKLKSRKGLMCRIYPKITEKPAEKLLKHFMPYGFYGKHDPYYFMETKSKKQRKRVYLAIINVIRNNKKLKSKRRKKLYDFNYDSILKHMRIQRSPIKVAPYKIKQVGLLKTLIEWLDMEGKTIYDVYPMMGEMHIAAHIKECPYYYRESAPFDQGAEELSKFIGSHCKADDGKMRYDFGICDFGIYEGHSPTIYDKLCCAFEIMKIKVDLAVIFIPYKDMNQWREKHPESHDSIYTKCSKAPHFCGEWLLYYN